MIKKLLSLLLCVCSVLIVSLAFAADVVVTKRGKKYHLPTCSLVVGKKTSTMDEQQALAKALKPCDKCIKTK